MEKSLRVAGKNGRRRRHGQEGNQGQDRSAQERAVSGFPQSGYGELGGGPPAKRNSARHAKSPRSITLSLVRSAAERQGKGLFWNRKDSNRELSPTSTEKSRFRSPRINAGKHSSGILSPLESTEKPEKMSIKSLMPFPLQSWSPHSAFLTKSIILIPL